MPKARDRLFVDKKDLELYKRSKSEDMFRDKDNKDLFILAMAYGYKNNVKRALEAREGYVRTEYLKAEDLALINGLAISTESVETLSTPERVFQLAEEYAHAGIRLLVDKIESGSFGSFEKKFEKELHQMYAKELGRT